MLIVYSVQGSPGASTTAIHIAAHWASSGQEVLILEADPAGGSLSRHLGIQFTPGTASFIASGASVRKSELIDHSQDVLFSNLHIMPSPASPLGTKGIIETFGKWASDLRSISENGMAVLIDAGRITPTTATAKLLESATGVFVVARRDSVTSLESLTFMREFFSKDTGEKQVPGFAATVGEAPWSKNDWETSCGLNYYGSLVESAEISSDLSFLIGKPKRKNKLWRKNLELLANQLLPYAMPDPAAFPRREVAETQPADAEADDAEVAKADDAPAAEEPTAPSSVETQTVMPDAHAVVTQTPTPAPESMYPPAASQPAAYFPPAQPAPPAPPPQPIPPEYQQPGPYPPLPPAQQTPYDPQVTQQMPAPTQQHYAAPAPYYPEHPPPAHPPPAYGPAPTPHPHADQTPGVQAPGQYVPPPAQQEYPDPSYQANYPYYQQTPPAPPAGQPASPYGYREPQQDEPELPSLSEMLAELEETGSFRDVAARLHGQSGTTQQRGIP